MSAEFVSEHPKDYEVTDLITLADEPDNFDDVLLGPKKEGYLSREGGMFIIGPTSCGKSSLVVQLAIGWACGYKSNSKMPIASTGPLRVLVVQSEDNRQDAREMARAYKRLGLSPVEIALVKQNSRFIRWRTGGHISVGPDGESTHIPPSQELVGLLEEEIKRGGPVDIIIVNPLSAYVEEGVMNQKENRSFFYGVIDPFLVANRCAIVFIHHTPKFRDDKQRDSYFAKLYAGAGESTLANWPRSQLFIEPDPDFENVNVFRLRLGKRGERLLWDGPHRFFKWAMPRFFWEEVPFKELKEMQATVKDGRGRGRRQQSISIKVACEAWTEFGTPWVKRGDLAVKLRGEPYNYTKTTTYDALDQVDGYLRDNFLYRGKGHGLELKWKGVAKESLV